MNDKRMIADLLNALERIEGLAEEAIECRRISEDPEDHELLPSYEEDLAAARDVMGRARLHR